MAFAAYSDAAARHAHSGIAGFTLAGSDVHLCTSDLPVRTVLKCVAAQDGIPAYARLRETLCFSSRRAE